MKSWTRRSFLTCVFSSSLTSFEPLLSRTFTIAACIGEMQDLLIEDIEALVSAFSAVANSLVDVRLDRISHDACWKVHRDTVETRLLTTYRGPATEWVLPEHAAQALREQKKFKGPIERLRDHDVALFKGSEAGTGRGIVHRSPPIVGTGCTRLLLCLNLPSDVSPEQYSKYL